MERKYKLKKFDVNSISGGDMNRPIKFVIMIAQGFSIASVVTTMA